ncbi:MAG TPA: hypothetical protein VJK52_05265 [Candidatus Nanoarchaeia archaeon]|nr:hypothetical protein [Candidatus Nanoarchaeia archaeon]
MEIPDSLPVVEDLVRRLESDHSFASPFTEQLDARGPPYDTHLVVRPYACEGQIPEYPTLQGWMITASRPHSYLSVCLAMVSKKDCEPAANPFLHRRIKIAAAEVSAAHPEYFCK